MKSAQKRGLLRSKIIVAGITFLCAYAQMNAQSSTGSIEGVTVDSSGAVIAGAKVSLVCNCNECPNRPCAECCPSARSDEEGRFRLKNVPVGIYTLKGTAAGFQEVEVHDVRVRANSTQTVTVTFKGNKGIAVTVASKNNKATAAKVDESAATTLAEFGEKVHLVLEVINKETEKPLSNAKVILHRQCDCKVECPTKPCAECCPSEIETFFATTDALGAVQFKGDAGTYLIATEYRAYSKDSLVHVKAGETEKVKIALEMMRQTGPRP